MADKQIQMVSQFTTIEFVPRAEYDRILSILKDKENELAKVRAELTAANEHIYNLENVIIKDLKEEIVILKEKIKTLEQDKITQNDRIVFLEKENLTQEDRINNLEKNVEVLKKEIDISTSVRTMNSYIDVIKSHIADNITIPGVQCERWDTVAYHLRKKTISTKYFEDFISNTYGIDPYVWNEIINFTRYRNNSVHCDVTCDEAKNSIDSLPAPWNTRKPIFLKFLNATESFTNN